MSANNSCILAIDTTLGACSAAIGTGTDGLLAFEFEERAKGHAEAIVPMVERVLAQSGRGRGDLTGIACTTGPGSFTGLRVGLAAAKGLAIGLKRPLCGVPTLEALAAGLLYDRRGEGSEAKSITAVIDGPREGFILQQFSIDRSNRKLMSAGPIEALAARDAAGLELAPDEILVGPAAARLGELGKIGSIKARVQHPDARILCRYALEAGADRWGGKISAVYFRPPHAEPAKSPPWIKPGVELS